MTVSANSYSYKQGWPNLLKSVRAERHISINVKTIFLIILSYIPLPIIYYYYLCTAVVVNFSQPVYTVEENSRVAEIQLIFSNPSSIDITIEVNSEEINATGWYPMYTSGLKLGHNHCLGDLLTIGLDSVTKIMS